ncbi:MAG: class I SAM-dependent RNA methyltransferase [Clostridiales bacterium]|nr:class I SAM-dependent RNA methyltransferase [Clostridiales bacterium]
MKLRLIATAVFGMEAIVAQEIKDLGFENVVVENGRVLFDSDELGLARANMWLRTAERVFICVGQFKANKFETLFDEINKLPWEVYIAKDAAFPVDAKSVKSTLFSLSDIQSLTKKAIVKRLTKLYRVEWFEETQETYRILVSILKDEVTVSIDTSGSGLHRRGYRAKGNEAPLKETLAAGLLLVSKWKAERPLIDPFCGSGTIVIEAAMMAKNIAPGLNREFDSEKWRWIEPEIWEKVRNEAKESVIEALDVKIEGYDMDPRAISIARENAALAGVADIVHFQVRDVKDFSTSRQYGTIICNPPYGERLNEVKEVEQLYKVMGKVFKPYTTWSKYIITSHDGFENAYGEKSTKNRKLYNGRIKTHFYMYFGERPPRQPKENQ